MITFTEDYLITQDRKKTLEDTIGVQTSRNENSMTHEKLCLNIINQV